MVLYQGLRIMHFTVIELFNYKSFGLTVPHYAVVAAMPVDMGAGRRVVDMVAVEDVKDAASLRDAFARAKTKMPHRVSPEGGGEIDFYGSDHQGACVKQSTAYIPARSLTGETLEGALLGWLSWRARVALWLQDDQRPSLSPAQEARILEEAVLSRPVFSVRPARPARADYLSGVSSAPLTAGTAPL